MQNNWLPQDKLSVYDVRLPILKQVFRAVLTGIVVKLILVDIEQVHPRFIRTIMVYLNLYKLTGSIFISTHTIAMMAIIHGYRKLAQHHLYWLYKYMQVVRGYREYMRGMLLTKKERQDTEMKTLY